MCSLARHDAPCAAQTTPQAAAAMVAQARALADQGASDLKPLRGKHLALFSAARGDEAERDFIAAAMALGAQVSPVLPGLDESSSCDQIDAIAEMLNRLYDAVECQHLPETLVRRIAQATAIPVFLGLAMPEHPTAALAEELDESLPLADKRRRILQAALLLAVNR